MKARDRGAVYNILAQHLIFSSCLSNVTRKDTIFYTMLQNGDGKLAICLVLLQDKSGPDRIVKVYCCYKSLVNVLSFNHIKQGYSHLL